MSDDLPAGGCWFAGGSAFVSGRTIRARKASTSANVGGHEACGASWEGGEGFASAAAGCGICDATVGVFSDGVDKATPGVFSNGRAGPAAVDRMSTSAG